MGAYFELYLEDVNELQQYIFEYAARQEIDYENFVEKYMNCSYRNAMDKGCPRIFNMCFDEFWAYLRKDCKELFRSGKRMIDDGQSGWIGLMYNLLQYHTSLPSSQIYKKLPLSKMMYAFIPLHTVDEEIALEKLLPHFNGTEAESSHL